MTEYLTNKYYYLINEYSISSSRVRKFLKMLIILAVLVREVHAQTIVGSHAAGAVPDGINLSFTAAAPIQGSAGDGTYDRFDFKKIRINHYFSLIL